MKEIIWDYLIQLNEKEEESNSIKIYKFIDNSIEAKLFTSPEFIKNGNINKYRTYIYFKISINYKIVSSDYEIIFDEIYNKGLFEVFDIKEEEFIKIILPVIRDNKLKELGI